MNSIIKDLLKQLNKSNFINSGIVTGILGGTYGLISSYLLRGKLTIFVYHDVTTQPSEFSQTYNLHVSPEMFEKQIQFITKNFNVINTDDLLESKIPDKAALITFDDGFKSVFYNAIPIMTKYKVPCLVLLNMEPVQGKIFWSGLITYLCKKSPDFVQYLRKQQPTKFIDKALFLSCSKAVVENYLKNNSHASDSVISDYYGEFANNSDLKNESTNQLVNFGNHLYNHYVPSLMSDEELLESYNNNEDDLRHFSNQRDVFAFPFGQPGTCFSEEQVQLLYKAGPKKIFYSLGGTNNNPTNKILDRMTLTSNHNSCAKMWMQVLLGQIKGLFYRSHYPYLYNPKTS
jgi:hypothetical protein